MQNTTSESLAAIYSLNQPAKFPLKHSFARHSSLQPAVQPSQSTAYAFWSRVSRVLQTGLRLYVMTGSSFSYGRRPANWRLASPWLRLLADSSTSQEVLAGCLLLAHFLENAGRFSHKPWSERTGAWLHSLLTADQGLSLCH